MSGDYLCIINRSITLNAQARVHARGIMRISNRYGQTRFLAIQNIQRLILLTILKMLKSFLLWKMPGGFCFLPGRFHFVQR